ncbi:PREDICTED: immunoglobulin alpha Fc receptor-like [Propithecus coquereli]|uniref:immunoglobulin alpha Fc receptor-like n=1 Tax=Propithecus coquereli TaxID=379532 RepID=UPI00063F0080|nr:PREDICTED: immunoglobulin alpha Fc receptor-like [Propithecus coquereli]
MACKDTTILLCLVLCLGQTIQAQEDSMNQDYTVGNLTRMGVAGLILLALLAILAEHWHSHRMPHKESWPHLAEPSWRKQKYETEWALGQTSSGHR